MPDEVQVTQKQETTEVLTPPSESANNLSALFDRMETAKNEGGSTKDAIIEFRQEKAVKQESKPTQTEAKVAEEPKKAETELDKKLAVKDEKKAEETAKETPEDPREALKKAFETRQKDKEDKKAVEDQAGKHDDDVPDDELKPLPTDKPKTVKRIQALLKKIDTVSSEKATTAAERDAKAKELEELRKQVAEVKTVNPETEAKLKQYQDELAMYRRRYDLEKDPEVKSKFDGRVEAAEQSITDTLKKASASEALLNLIKDTGGWQSFASSAKLVSVPDGDGGTEQITTAELADRILKTLPLGERKAVEAAMMDQVSTKRERDRYFKDEQAKASEFFKKREEEAAKQSEEQGKYVETAKKTVDEFVKKVEASDWLKDKEAAANATEQERKAVQEYNRYNSQLRSYLKKAIATNDLPGLLSIVEDSVRYYDERRTTASLQEENARLRSELKAKDEKFAKFQKAGSSVPKQGSIAVSQAKSSDDDEDDKPASSLEEQFKRMERRKMSGETLLTNR